jgi:hypothetical protein
MRAIDDYAEAATGNREYLAHRAALIQATGVFQ